MAELTVQQDINRVIDYLFRNETGKIVSVLTRVFGADNIELAEDVVQDSMLEALKNWQSKGLPDNPSAWLFTVAKNKALNVLSREKNKQRYATDAANLLQSEWTSEPALDHLFSEPEILDDQLRMIFTCCHPAISSDSQIALALKTLCGFSIPEIARSFLTTEENIHKRLVRARQRIREAEIPFEVPNGKELAQRLETVLETIYLLFNEGYSASKGNDVIRYEICQEAVHLAEIIIASKSIANKGNVYALLALMLLNASRFNARQDDEGNLVTMAEQDRTLWDEKMKSIGFYYLQESTKDGNLSIYHILSAISAQYCVAPDYESTDWGSILSLYDSLLVIYSSPVVLLNRAVALSKVKGPQAALDALKQIESDPSLKSYYLHYSTAAEFYAELRQQENAEAALKKAIALAPLKAEKLLLQKKLERLMK
jgi:RNA polymerase sigma factor (sigma-70 family)